MKIPEKIRIGGVDYVVNYEDNVVLGDTLCYGAINYEESTISLSNTRGAGHQHRCITLWHEILHGIRNHAGIEVENEEAVVDMFAKGIYQVLQDNGRALFDLRGAENES